MDFLKKAAEKAAKIFGLELPAPYEIFFRLPNPKFKTTKIPIDVLSTANLRAVAKTYGLLLKMSPGCVPTVEIESTSDSQNFYDDLRTIENFAHKRLEYVNDVIRSMWKRRAENTTVYKKRYEEKEIYEEILEGAHLLMQPLYSGKFSSWREKS